MKKVEDYVRSIPDFPEKGIIFRDITSVIQSPEGLKLAIDGINESDRKSTRLNSSHRSQSRMPSSA